jgi:hypothetical protein
MVMGTSGGLMDGNELVMIVLVVFVIVGASWSACGVVFVVGVLVSFAGVWALAIL